MGTFAIPMLWEEADLCKEERIRCGGGSAFPGWHGHVKCGEVVFDSYFFCNCY